MTQTKWELRRVSGDPWNYDEPMVWEAKWIETESKTVSQARVEAARTAWYAKLVDEGPYSSKDWRRAIGVDPAMSPQRQMVQQSVEPPQLTAQMFEDAVEHINAHGWTQGRAIDHQTGAVCAYGAFARWTMPLVQGRGADFDRELGRTFDFRLNEIRDLMGIDRKRWMSVISWNDAPGRTEDEVIDALTCAAKKLRELGR